MLIALSIALAWSMLSATSLHRRWLEKLFWGIILAGFGVKIRSTGYPVSSAIIAANHISWLDIPVMAWLCPATFVAKNDIENWAILGRLARRHGCIFVERHRRTSTASEVHELRSVVHSGRSAVLFPEGTTGDGFSVREFKSSLFESACSFGAKISPVAISYRNRDASVQTWIQRRLVAWLGDDSLLPHALELAAAGGVIAHVHFLDCIEASDRKQAAIKCREAIMRQLELTDCLDQAAMRNRVA